MTKFYVIVPVYNVEKYIKNCIESIIQQDYENYHLILVDDGSTDKSGDICDSYGSNEKITVLHQKNKGPLAARQLAINRILENSQNENAFVVFVDADDSLKNDTFKILSKIIEEAYPDMVVFGMDRVMEGKVIEPGKRLNVEGIVQDKAIAYKNFFGNSSLNSLCRKVVSTKLIEKMDFEEYFHIRYGEDLLQSLPYYQKAKRIYFLNENLYNYTFNPESATNTISYNNFKVDFTVREKVFEFIQKENVFTETDYQEYRAYCISLIVDKIMLIGGFKTSFKNKWDLLNEIYNSEYYKHYIYKKKYSEKIVGKKNIIYKLFEIKSFKILLKIIGLYRKIK